MSEEKRLSRSHRTMHLESLFPFYLVMNAIDVT